MSGGKSTRGSAYKASTTYKSSESVWNTIYVMLTYASPKHESA